MKAYVEALWRRPRQRMTVSNSRHSRHRHRHSTSLPLDMDLPAPTTDGITHVGTQSESLLISCAHQMSTLVKQHSHPLPLGSLPSPVAVPPPPPHILTFTPSERTRQSQLPLPPLTLLFADLDPSIPIRATTSDPANPTSSTSPRTHSLKIGWRRRANRLQVLASALLQETQARLLPSSQPHIAARPTPMLTTLFCLQPIQTR